LWNKKELKKYRGVKKVERLKESRGIEDLA